MNQGAVNLKTLMIQYHGFETSGSEEEGLDLTALIDVIFTLIIFLILTMGTTQIMTEVRVSPSKKPLVTTSLKEEPLVIEVGHENRFWKIASFKVNRFESFQQHFLTVYGNENNRPVVLALERTLPVENLVSLMDFLAINGFSNIQIVSKWSP